MHIQWYIQNYLVRASNQAFRDAIYFQYEQRQELVIIADRILLHVLGDASIFSPAAIHNLQQSIITIYLFTYCVHEQYIQCTAIVCIATYSTSSPPRCIMVGEVAVTISCTIPEITSKVSVRVGLSAKSLML